MNIIMGNPSTPRHLTCGFSPLLRAKSFIQTSLIKPVVSVYDIAKSKPLALGICGAGICGAMGSIVYCEYVILVLSVIQPEVLIPLSLFFGFMIFGIIMQWNYTANQNAQDARAQASQACEQEQNTVQINQLLRQDNQLLQQQKMYLENNNEALKVEIKAIKEINEETEKERNQCKGRELGLRMRCDELQQRIIASENDIKSLKEEKRDLEFSNKNYQDVVEASDKREKKLEYENQLLKEKSQYAQNAAYFQQNIEQMQSQLETKKANMQVLQTQYAEIEKQYEDTSKKYESLLEQARLYQGQFYEIQEAVTELFFKNERKEETKRNLEQSIQVNEASIKKLKEADIQSSEEVLKVLIDYLARSVLSENVCVDFNEERLAGFGESVQKFRGIKSDKTYLKGKKQILSSKAFIDGVSSIVPALLDLTQSMEKERDRYLRKLEWFQKEKNTLEISNQALKALNDKLTSYKEKSEALEDQVKTLTDQIKKLTQSHEVKGAVEVRRQPFALKSTAKAQASNHA